MDKPTPNYNAQSAPETSIFPGAVCAVRSSTKGLVQVLAGSFSSVKKHHLFAFFVSVGLWATPIVRADAPPGDTTPSTPVPSLSPEDEAKTFVLPEGYRLGLTHKDFKPGLQPRMLKESSIELVAHLEHPNGWWRDTAQQTLVLRGDKTVAPDLEAMESNADDWIAAVASYVRNGFVNHATLVDTNDVARVRAAIRGRNTPWTLEELQAAVPQVLANRSQWQVTASHNPGVARQAVDGDLNTRYDTGAYQAPGMWFQIELPQETTINALELDAGASAYDYPRGYHVQLSKDGQHWGEPVASGLGKKARTEIEFKPSNARFIRITQTGAVKGGYWSIHEMKIYQPGR
jgi:hypothetical protein